MNVAATPEVTSSETIFGGIFRAKLLIVSTLLLLFRLWSFLRLTTNQSKIDT